MRCIDGIAIESQMFRRLRNRLTRYCGSPSGDDTASASVGSRLFRQGFCAYRQSFAIRDLEMFIEGCSSMLPLCRSLIPTIGNVEGRTNSFFLVCRKAEGGELGHAYYEIIATDAVAAGVFPQEELVDARRALPDAVFRELYLCEPSDDDGSPFGLKILRANFVVRIESPCIMTQLGHPSFDSAIDGMQQGLGIEGAVKDHLF